MKALAVMFAVILLEIPAMGSGPGVDPKPEMHLLAKEILILQRFLLTESGFSSTGNDKDIKKSLSSLKQHLGYLGKQSFKEDPALRANLSLLQQHITDASASFLEGNKGFARYMLQSSLQMCIACHTRKKASDFSWPEPEAKDAPALDRADYLFATRQFSKGRELYESTIGGFPGNGVAQWTLRRAMASLAIYYARVVEDPRAGAEYFRKVAGLGQLPSYLRDDASAWAKEFDAWAQEAKSTAKSTLTESEMLEQAKKLLKHDEFTLVSELSGSFHVRRLRATSLFHQILESPGEKSPAKAQALLFLGQIYPRIVSNLFFRFGDMYLKACITEYPKSAAARSCYAALELSVVEGFSGSGGTNIPKSEEEELIRLRRVAF